MKFINYSLLFVAAIFLQPQAAEAQFNWLYQIKEGKIITRTPERPAGQQTAINLVTPKINVVRVGFVGLGSRGSEAIRRWTYQKGVQITALCDHEQARADSANTQLRAAGLPPADEYSGEKGYEQLCKRSDIDLVYIATDWLHHFPVAKCALENGKNVAIEVPSAMNLHEIWSLINLAEQKRLHCVMLENCCYDFFELNSLEMARRGVFGDVLYAMGAYRHDLSPYWDFYWKKDKNDKLGWRMDYNMKFRGDVYATHGLGPIAQVLNIHRGDRMKTLIAMDTKSVNGIAKAEQMLGEKVDSFRQGDQTTTMIRTQHGKIIEIQHNTMCPEPYNRMYQLTGTRGFANKYPVEGYAITADQMKSTGIRPSSDYIQGHEFMPEKDKNELEKKYESPLVTKYVTEAKEVGGHGGMDFIMDSRLIYCLQHGLPMDIDIYDLAEWCCFAELGSLSMDNGCMPVEVPDFTRGHWNDVKGYSHAFAPKEEEAAQEAANETFTKSIKAQAPKLWKKYDRKNKR
jgi:predicted dehydrogenase